MKEDPGRRVQEGGSRKEGLQRRNQGGTMEEGHQGGGTTKEEEPRRRDHKGGTKREGQREAKPLDPKWSPVTICDHAVKKYCPLGSHSLSPSPSHMSSFIPGYFGEYSPPLGEEPSHPECPQDPGQTNLMISEMLQVTVDNSMPDPLNDTLKALVVEPSLPEKSQDPKEIYFSAVQHVVITTIHATDLTLSLRRIPAGFHVVIKTDGAECQMSNKHVHVDQAVIEWTKPIILLCNPPSKVRVSVYASFELGPMLGHGEVLRTFKISVQELLDRSEKSHHVKEYYSHTRSAQAGGSHISMMQNSRDIDQSINHFECTSDLCPMDHPYRPAALLNLATAKFVSCQADGRHLDLDIPINMFQDALDLCPTDHPDRTITQLHLTIALQSRFEKRGFQTDADAARELLSKVLDVCHANSHIYRAALIAIKIPTLYSAESIDANDLGQEWPAAPMLLLSLHQLGHQAEQCLQKDDPHALDEVISLHYDVLVYYNTGHAFRGPLLGNEEDLDQAIALQMEALALYPVGHTDRSKLLNGLANQLSSCFGHRGNNKDLHKAIALHRGVLALHPHQGNEEDLDQAIALQMEALALRLASHTDQSKSLNNLATELSSHFGHRGNVEDLDQAITLQMEVLALCPVGHADWSSSLHNLATQLSSRFEHRGNNEDLDQAITLHREVLALHLVGHAVHNSLAEVYLSFHHSGLDGIRVGEDTDSLNSAMHHLKATANVVSRGSLSRLFSIVLSQYHEGLAMDAASCALRSGDVCRTVELLEQGRTIIWTQMTRLCTPLDSLQTCGDHAAALVKKFRDLSSLLDKPPANDLEATTRVDVEAEETRYRRLVKDWNRAVEEIWKIEGFSCFLLPPLFSDLQDAARDGPIIVLIASKLSCHAIIVLHEQPPTNIQLPTNLEKLQTLVVKLKWESREALKKVLMELWNDNAGLVVKNLHKFAQPGSVTVKFYLELPSLKTSNLKSSELDSIQGHSPCFVLLNH
ncbi:hypothetical protein F4604DRAFT_1984150 [Suillus subluteus]|nr:hypothetical protein F4604DRAFT_1984150 [Suillus subluteus]